MKKSFCPEFITVLSPLTARNLPGSTEINPEINSQFRMKNGDASTRARVFYVAMAVVSRD